MTFNDTFYDRICGYSVIKNTLRAAPAADAVEDGVGVLEHLRAEPAAEKHNRKDDGEKFDGEGEGLLLDLRSGLENGDHKSEDRADDDGRPREEQDQDQSLVGELVDFVGKHGFPI